jgi:hypothetical protein
MTGSVTAAGAVIFFALESHAANSSSERCVDSW